MYVQALIAIVLIVLALLAALAGFIEGVDIWLSYGLWSAAAVLLLIGAGLSVQLFKKSSEEDLRRDAHPKGETWFHNKWAVLIGIDEYEHVKPPLKFAGADVAAVGKALCERLDFPQENILEFHKAAKRQPTRETIFNDLAKLRQSDRVGENDLLILYFSGHGMINAPDKKDYLMTPGSSPATLENTAIRVEVLIGELKKTRCKNIVAFIDACREVTDGARGVKSIGEETRDAAKRSGIVTFFSCAPEERSFEIEELKHGSFTHCILNAIERGECGTVGELDDYLRNNVPLINAKYGKDNQGPYAVIEPGEKTKLQIFSSATQRQFTEGELRTLHTEFSILVKPLGLEYKYCAEVWGVIARAIDRKMEPDDKAKLRAIKSFCESGDLANKEYFEQYWDGIKTRPKSKAERKLGSLR